MKYTICENHTTVHGLLIQTLGETPIGRPLIHVQYLTNFAHPLPPYLSI